jgi:hypothetical protein
MSIFNDKALKGVAEAAAKIMQQEELKGNQHKIDANKNGKIDSHDFKLLRAKKGMKEEVKDEYARKVDKYLKKKYNKEEVELDEAFPTVADAAKRMKDAESSKFEKQKSSKGTIYTKKHTEKDAEYEAPKPAGRKRMIGKGSDNPDHMKKMKMTEMLEAYQEGGLKALNSMLVVEEPDNEQFTKEFEDQKASMEGKKKQPSVAAAATKGVKEMPEETDVDPDDFISETEEVELDERTLTKGEAETKEKYVKGMKKGLSGFKARYGERAKSVMYATATKMAKKD